MPIDKNTVINLYNKAQEQLEEAAKHPLSPFSAEIDRRLLKEYKPDGNVEIKVPETVQMMELTDLQQWYGELCWDVSIKYSRKQTGSGVVNRYADNPYILILE